MAAMAPLVVAQNLLPLLEEALRIGGTLFSSSGTGVLATGIGTAVAVWEVVKAWTNSSELTEPKASRISDVLRQVEDECRRYDKLVKDVEPLMKGTEFGELKQSLSNLVQTHKQLQTKLREVEELQRKLKSLKMTRNVQEEIEILCNNVEKAVYEMACHVDYLKMEVRVNKIFQLIFHEEVGQCKSLMQETFSHLGIEAQEDELGRCVETFFRWSVATELSKISDQEYESWIVSRQKGKIRESILTEFRRHINLARKEHEENDKSNVSVHHVINKGVLKIHKDILTKFMMKNQIPLNYAESLQQIKRDIEQPLQSEKACKFVATTAVKLTGNKRKTPDINSFLFGAANYVLIELCVSHMSEMYRHASKNLYLRGTKSSTNVKWLCRLMNMCSLITNEPIYVDQEALEQWLRQGGVRGDYMFARGNVENMFIRLFDKMTFWVSMFGKKPTF